MNKFPGLGLFTQWTITAAGTDPHVEGTPWQYEQWGSYKPNPGCRASLEVLISWILEIWRYSSKDHFTFALRHFISSCCGWSLRWRECWENMWRPEDVPAYFGLRGAFWTWISQIPPPPQDTSKMRKSNLLKPSLRNEAVVAQPSPAHITTGPCKPT